MKKIVQLITAAALIAASVVIANPPQASAHTPSCGDHRNTNQSFALNRRQSLTGEQVGNARLIMGIAKERGLTKQAAQVAITASIQASSLRNSPGNTNGLFQQSKRYYPGVDVSSPRSATNAFFDRLTRVPRWQSRSLSQAAQSVQFARSANSFTKGEPLAKAITDKWWNNSANPTTCPTDGASRSTQTQQTSTQSQKSTTQRQVTKPPILKIRNTRRVSVNGIVVDRSIGTNLQNLLVAAKRDGLNLSGFGWRDPARQIALRKQNCGTSNYSIYRKSPSLCSPPTARPGTSNHEKGLAVDFRNCSTRATRCYKWLNRNAAKFGLRNLPSEPWHWSTNGR